MNVTCVCSAFTCTRAVLWLINRGHMPMLTGHASRSSLTPSPNSLPSSESRASVWPSVAAAQPRVPDHTRRQVRLVSSSLSPALFPLFCVSLLPTHVVTAATIQAHENRCGHARDGCMSMRLGGGAGLKCMTLRSQVQWPFFFAES
jgi:hypothetical protein